MSHALFAGNAAKARSEGEPHDESRRVFNALERGRAMNGSKAPDFSVAGQHVLISGGAGGIGTALSRAFRDSGAIVTITDIKSPANDEGFRFEQLDVRDDAAVEALAAKIGTLHVLIHCAGRLIRHEEHKPEVFRDIIFGAAMIPGYAAAKTGIVGLTKSLALAYAEDGIRVNAVAPGWINTEISRRGREEEAFNAKVMARLPTKRWSEPEELAGTAVFLASPAARLINGVTIPVDGGYVAS